MFDLASCPFCAAPPWPDFGKRRRGFSVVRIERSIVWWEQTIVWWEHTMVCRQQTIVWREQTIGDTAKRDKKRQYRSLVSARKALIKWYLAAIGSLCRKTCKDLVKLR